MGELLWAAAAAAAVDDGDEKQLAPVGQALVGVSLTNRSRSLATLRLNMPQSRMECKNVVRFSPSLRSSLVLCLVSRCTLVYIHYLSLGVCLCLVCLLLPFPSPFKKTIKSPRPTRLCSVLSQLFIHVHKVLD